MAYTQKLPSLRIMRFLADIDGPFPIKNRHVVLAARRFRFDDNVINFLQQFPADEIFASRDDFVERCRDLEILIRQEQESPQEILHSPQG